MNKIVNSPLFFAIGFFSSSLFIANTIPKNAETFIIYGLLIFAGFLDILKTVSSNNKK